MHHFMIVVWTSLLILFSALPAFAEKRVALLIGNQTYHHMPRLKNPRRDASELAAALKRLGFETTYLPDADAESMSNALKRFAQGAAGADIIFLFYSGHGPQCLVTDIGMYEHGAEYRCWHARDRHVGRRGDPG